MTTGWTGIGLFSLTLTPSLLILLRHVLGRHASSFITKANLPAGLVREAFPANDRQVEGFGMAGAPSLLAGYTVAKTAHPCKRAALSRQAARVIGFLFPPLLVASLPACLARKPRNAPLMLVLC